VLAAALVLFIAFGSCCDAAAAETAIAGSAAAEP